ncbi:hypothetical protein TNCV_2604991 [Trichonephila clavipes]|nr:hypothetical protein TNCV_2604991 [Trichonephila clavipes]
MLLQTLSNCSCRYLLSCKRPPFLTQGSQRGCTIQYGHEGNMPVFSAARNRGPLRSSMAFRITILILSIPYSANSYWISTEQAAIMRCDAINRNPGTVQFDLYQSQKRTDTHLCFFHEASQQFFTRQQHSNAIYERNYEKRAEQFHLLYTL